MANLTNKDVAELARIVAYLADAVAQQLDGSMPPRDAAANLHNLNSQAAALHQRLS